MEAPSGKMLQEDGTAQSLTGKKCHLLAKIRKCGREIDGQRAELGVEERGQNSLGSWCQIVP